MKDTSKSPHISYETIRRRALALNRKEIIKARFGSRVADKQYKAVGKGIDTHYPLEIVEIDHTILDVITIDEETGAIMPRPVLTTVIDCYSRAVLGYHLDYTAACAESVLAALRMAILPKTELNRRFININYRCDLFGMPVTIKVDNGLDLLGRAVTNTCQALGISIRYAPPRVPWYKGIVERYFKTLNISLIHILPGTTFSGPNKDNEYNPEKHACITLNKLEELLFVTIFKVYNESFHSGINDTPMARWREGIQRFPVRSPLNSDAFDLAFTLPERRTIQRYGIELHNLNYNSSELANIRNHLGERKKIDVRVNPADIRYVWVIDPMTQTPLRVPCTTSFERPLSQSLYEKIRDYAKAKGLNHVNNRIVNEGKAHILNEIEKEKKSKGKLNRNKAATQTAHKRTADDVAVPTAENDSTLSIENLLRQTRHDSDVGADD